MAQVPYKAAPNVEPAAAPPPDYQHLDVSANTFGGHIAKGIAQVGEEVSKTADLWGQLQVDAQANKTLKAGDDLLNHLRSLHGQEQIDFANSLPAQLDQVVSQGGQGLSPVQKLRYENVVRPYQYRLWNGETATSSAKAAGEVAKETNNDTIAEATNRAANHWNNPNEFQSAVADTVYGYQQHVKFEGNENVPGAMENARKQGTMEAYKAAALRIYTIDKQRALDFAKKNEGNLGAAASPLEHQFMAGAEKEHEEQKADVLGKIYDIKDPIARAGAARANAGILGADTVRAVTGEPTPAAAGNVVQLRPAADAATRLLEEVKGKPEAQPTTPPQRLPNETLKEWTKRDSSQNFSPTAGSTSALPVGEQESNKVANYSPAQTAIARTIDSRTDKDLEVRKLPGNTLEQAKDVALLNGPDGLQKFMAAQGYPKDGKWCGEFAAAIVRGTGGKPPNNPQVASNWRTWGQPTSNPKIGDIAVRRGVPIGSTGGHVTFVENYSPEKGTFTAMGGNQGSRVRATYHIADYEFRNGIGD